MFRDLSFRYKIPLRGTVLILVTALSVTSALLFRSYDDLRRDLIANAEAMSRVMAHTLVPALLKDDLWRTYETIRTPFKAELSFPEAFQAEAVIVLTNNLEVYAASHPRRFPTLMPVADSGRGFERLAARLGYHPDTEPLIAEIPGDSALHVVTPIVSDGVRLGLLVMEYDRALFTPRFLRFAARAAVVTALVLAALVPLSWYWGAHMARPLVTLADCMGRVGPEIPDATECRLYDSRDELGQLGVRFRHMLAELKEKEGLERQMIAAERLAAVGRLTASIGHEINNPLGGMLNAISTYRRYGEPDAVSQRTIDLLERGLLQIRDTVSALLVEAKPTSRRFNAHDVEDVRTLITPDVQRQKVQLHWSSDVAEIPLPATLVRQVLINLLLNAVKAAPPGGAVHCHLSDRGDTLLIAVRNDGAPIPREQLERLFEPFVHYRGDGNGLGLWVCYQIVDQLGGTIDVHSDDSQTRFTVSLPTTT